MRIKVKRPTWDDFTSDTTFSTFSTLKSTAGTDLYVLDVNNPAWTFITVMNMLKGFLGNNVPPIGDISITGYNILAPGYKIDFAYPGQEGISSEAPCYLTFAYNGTPVALALWINGCN